MGNQITCTRGNEEDSADAKKAKKEKKNRPVEKKEGEVEENGDAKKVATVEITTPEDESVTEAKKPEDDKQSDKEHDDKEGEKENVKVDEPNEKADDEQGQDNKDTTPDTDIVEVAVEEEMFVKSATVVTGSPPVVDETPKDEIREDIVESVTIETVKLSVAHFIDDDAAGNADKTEVATGTTEKTVETYDSPEDIAKGKENFLIQFRNDHKVHAVDFMRIWRNYDTDKSGYLEKKELTRFLEDLMEQKGEKTNKKKVAEYEKIMMQTFDSNKDGYLEMGELANLLPVEHNFLAKFPAREKCSREHFNTVFDHFDKDKSGKIGHTELLALMKALFEKEGPQRVHVMKVSDLQSYTDSVFEIYDTNKDGSLSRDELGIVLSRS